MSSPNFQVLPDDNEHDRLYKTACAIISPHLPLHGLNRNHRAGFFLRRRLRKGIGLLERVIDMNGKNWAAMWVAGMACNRVGDLEKALTLFARAGTVCDTLPRADNHADVWREAGLAAMNLGRHAESAAYARRAMSLRASDPGLAANLALALLFAQDPSSAKVEADAALAADPADIITQNIVRIIDEVLAGRRPCPRGTQDLQRG